MKTEFDIQQATLTVVNWCNEIFADLISQSSAYLDFCTPVQLAGIVAYNTALYKVNFFFATYIFGFMLPIADIT